METHYTVLARRFRPQTFDEVVGQERIAKTLRNAILEGRVAHAYLFTGARGVGKTSMARIFAKSLNCPQADNGDPCNQCDQCRAISAGQDVDVSEIDGASNRGIDDIRLLRANVNVRSMRSRFKVYIIDEVHMLTKEAFNALLKTLEEPPPSVKFVFCTTEPQKVPDTILSRCQRFDFGTIATDSIADRLAQIAEAEGIPTDRAAVDLVARRAGGSMRDSQSLFDQVLAGVSGKLTIDEVHRLLGTAPDDRLHEIIESLIAKRRDQALSIFSASLSEGIQLDTISDQLLHYVRDMMVLAAGAAEAPLLGIDASYRDQLQDQAARFGLRNCVAALQILADARARMQRAGFGRALAELALVRISLLEDLRDLEQLIGELSGVSNAVAPASAAGQKKNDRPALGLGAPAVAASLSPAFRLQFDESATDEILSKVVSCKEDVAFSELANTKLAIRGPNHLDFVFPASYDFREERWGRPEIAAAIRKIVSDLTGVSPVVRIFADDAPAAAPEQVERPQPAPKVGQERFGRAENVDEISDPLVRKAVEMFGVTAWKMTERVVAAPPDESEDSDV